MRNKTLPRIAQVFGFILAMALMHASQAVQITMTVPDCPSGQSLTFTPSTNTLACTGAVVVAQTPGSCTITQSPDTTNGVSAGTQVTLTALCSTGLTPISYSWNLGVLGSSLTVAPAQTTQYTVTPTNSAGPGATFSTTVNIGTVTGGGQQPVVTAPNNCVLSQTPNTSITATTTGTTVTLQMSCSGGSAITSCSWSNGITGTACTVNVTAPSASTAYTATASNSAGSTSASATIYIAATGGGGGGNNIGQNFCTNSNDQIVNVGWPASGQIKPTTSGFGNGRIAFKITVPTTFNPALNINHIGFMRLAEIPGAAVVTRDYTVSKNSCDFQSDSYIFNGIGVADTAPYLSFTVNNPLGYFAAGATLNISAGDTIYFNVRNYFRSTPTCPFSSCDVSLDFATPNRY